MPFDESEKSDQIIKEQRRQNERDTQPRRIKGQQHDAFADRTLAGRDGQDGAENRADAGRPAERERHTDQNRTDNAEFLLPGVETFFVVESADFEYPGHVQTEQEDQNTADFI